MTTTATMPLLLDGDDFFNHAEPLVAYAQTLPPPSAISAIDDTDEADLALDGANSVSTILIDGDTYAIVASREDDGISIINITNPVHPIPVSTFVNGVDGNYLDNSWYVTTTIINDVPYALVASAADGNGFTIIDISDPAVPTLASERTDGQGEFTRLADPRGISVITIDGTPYALVGSDDEGSIHVVDISDPTAPDVVSTIGRNADGFNFDGPRSISTVMINDTPYAIVPSFGNQFMHIIDLSVPSAPLLVSILDANVDDTLVLKGSRSVTTVVIDDSTYAIVTSQSKDGIQIVNITNPANPVAISNVIDNDQLALDGARYVTTASIDGITYALVAGILDNGIQIIDISDPANPVPVYAIIDGMQGFTELERVSAIDVTVIDGITYAVVASARDDGIQIIDLVGTLTITLSALATDPTGLVSITFFVSFSESVAGFTSDDVEVSSGAVSEIGRRSDLVSSIGSGTRGSGDNQFDGSLGMHIDPNGLLYVTDFGNDRIQVYDTTDDNAYQRTYTFTHAVPDETDYRDVYVRPDFNTLYVLNSGFENRLERINLDDGITSDVRGSVGLNNLQFTAPEAITLSNDGAFIYVADTGNHRIKVHDAAFTDSTPDFYRGQFGSTITNVHEPGDGNGLLRNPTDVHLNSTGHIYVADTGNNLIQVFSTNTTENLHTFEFIAQFDGSTSGDTFNGPRGVAFDLEGNVYIADTGNNRIVIFDNTHTFLYQIDNDSLEEDDPNRLNAPFDIEFNPLTDELYVTNKDGNIVLVYASRLGFNVINSTDLQTLTVRIPEGTVQDSSGVYNPLGSNTISLEVDRIAPTVTLSLAAGTPDPTSLNPVPFVVSFSEYITEFVRDDITVVTPNTGTIPGLEPDGIALSALGTSGMAGNDLEQFDSPEGIAIGTDGRIYIADTDNNRVKIYQGGANGASYDGQFTLSNTGSPSRTVDATGLAIDTAGQRIYAISADIGRLAVFDLDGNDIWNRGSNGDGESTTFFRPQGIALTPDGNLVIADTRNNRIAIWNTTTEHGLGRHIAHFGGSVLSEPSEDGRGEGAFYQPRDVAFNSTGHLYVVDSGNDLIQVINNTIDDIEQLPDIIMPGGIPTANVTLNIPDESLRAFLTEFNGTGLAPDDTFDDPEGIALDSQDRIYIADTGNDRIVVFDNTHTFLYQIDNDFLAEDDPNRLNEPTDVVIDPDNNNLYVANRGDHNVIIYTEHPIYRFGVASPTDQEPLTVRMAAGVVDDVDGIPNTFASNEVTVNIDYTPPVLDDDAPVLDLVDGTLRFDFNEIIDISQIDLDGISISGNSGGNQTVLSGAAINTASPDDDSDVVIVQLTGTQRLGIIDVNHNDGPVLLHVTNTSIPNLARLGFAGLDNATLNLTPPAPIPLHQPVPVSTVFDNAALALDGANSVSTILIDGDTYAIVASRDDDGISIINITNPVHPIPVSTFVNGVDGNYLDNSWYVTTTVINDTPYALVASAIGGNGFTIIDISNPATPTLASERTDGQSEFTRLADPRGISVITIDGTPYALVGSDDEGSIHVVDVSDPTAPDVVATIGRNADGFNFDGPRSISTVMINDTPYAIVPSFGNQFMHIIDLSVPSAPLLASILDGNIDDTLVLKGSRSVTTVVIDEDTYAIVTSQDKDGIQIVNITNPANPVAISNVVDNDQLALDGARYVTTASIDGITYALVAGLLDNGIQIIDISDPANPVPVYAIIDGMQGFTELEHASSIDTAIIDGNTYAVVASVRDDGVQIIDLVGAPSVTVSTVITSPSTPERTVPITVTFSEPVTGFMTDDITVSSGTISAITPVTTSEYTFNVVDSTNLAPLIVDIRAAAAQDGQGLHNTASNRFSIGIDHNALFAFTTPIPSDDISVNVPYTVTVSLGAAVTTDPTAIDPVPFVVSFSRPVIGFTPDDVAISPAGTVTNFVKPVLLSINNTLGLGKDGITFNDVRDVATNSSGHIYVTDRNNHRVLIFDSIGTPVDSIGTLGQTGTTNDLFNQPAGLFINASNHVFITDASNHRVQIYDSNNVYQQTIGEIPFNADGDVEPSGGGDGPNEFKFPVDVATNSSGHIFITDNNNHRVQIYTSSGIYQSSIGSRSVDADGNPDDNNPDPDNLNRPFGVAINSTDHIYIADTLNARISVWDNSGNHLFNFGPDNTPGGYNLGLIGRIVFDSQDNLYVTDNTNDTIVVYDKTNTYQYYIGKNDSSGNPIAGSGPLEFNNQDGLSVDPATNLLYVADRDNERVQIINLPTPLPDYTFDIANTRNGLLSIHVPANVAQNLQGNPNPMSDIASVDIDRVSTADYELFASSTPTISDDTTPNNQFITLSLGPKVTTDPTDLVTIPFIVSFREPVTGFTLSDVAYSSGTPSNLAEHISSSIHNIFGQVGSGETQLNAPYDIATNSTGHIFVTDFTNQRIQIFDNAGGHVGSIGDASTGTSNNRFNKPAGIFINSTDHVFVVDQFNHRVQIFDSSNVWQQTLGTTNDFGNTNNQFYFPTDVATNSTGFIFVADNINNRIQIFDISGEYQYTIGITGESGDDANHFHGPQGIAINSSGYIYVADTNNDRISVFDSSGTPVTQFGNISGSFDGLDGPTDLAFDSNDYLYVADNARDRIVVYDNTNTLQYKIGRTTGNDDIPVGGSGDLQFDNPKGVSVDLANQRLYVADTNNDRIQIINMPSVMPSYTFDIVNPADNQRLNVYIPANTVQNLQGNYNVMSNTVSVGIDR